VKKRVLGVRAAVEADGAAIGEAHGAAWQAAYGHIFDATFLAAAVDGRRIGWPAAISRLLAAPNVLLVGEVDRRVVAFAHATPDEKSRVTAEIRGFYCHPDAWGSGIATVLMTHVCDTLTDAFDDVVLWTLRDAARARHFYEKVGFRTSGRVRAHALTDWTTGAAQERETVEYVKALNFGAPE
jgi:GNAT superfamily N-acetyltransferase